MSDHHDGQKVKQFKPCQGISRQTKHTGSDVWASWSDKQTIDTLRAIYGLPKVGTKEVLCLRCKLPYQSQTLGSRRVEFYCADCQSWQSKQTEWI